MDLYFAGGGSDALIKYMRLNNCHQLLSQLNDRRTIINWVEYLREHPECSSKLFVDSGAWTAYTKGRTIDTDDYINFINTYGDKVAIFASVDKIPGSYGNIPTEQEKAQAPIDSWNNYLYMWERVKYKDKLIPVFHYGESLEHLKQMIEYVHPDGSKVSYIGLGGIAGIKDDKARVKYFEDCFDVISRSNNPTVKTHGFGMTSVEILTNYPFTSADSTTWLRAATFGELCCFDPGMKNRIYRVKISERTELFNDNNAYSNFSSAKKATIEEMLKRYDMTVDDVRDDPEKRLAFNLLALKEWSDSYECEYEKNHAYVLNELF